MSLVEHARRELAIIGEDDTWTVEGIVSVVQAFAACGHSGGSAPYALTHLERLLRHEPLSPLTDDPRDWIDQSEISGCPMWQNQRDHRAISEDGGHTYWMTHEAEAAGGSEHAPRHSAQAHPATGMGSTAELGEAVGDALRGTRLDLDGRGIARLVTRGNEDGVKA